LYHFLASDAAPRRTIR